MPKVLQSEPISADADRDRALRAEEELRTLRRELGIAERIQQGILPQAFRHRPDIDVFAQMTPAKEMGGDFYDFFEVAPGRLGLVVADVAGKGVPAAFFMAVARTLMRAAAAGGTEPAACLARVNDLICEAGIDGILVSVFYAILDTADWRLTYANGGHLPPLVVAGNGDGARPLTDGDGIVLGVEPGLAYGQSVVRLEPDDALFCYTDGLTEAFNADGEQFSETRLTDILERSLDLSAQAIAVNVFDAVDHFAFGTEQHDDITCLVVKRRSDTCFTKT